MRARLALRTVAITALALVAGCSSSDDTNNGATPIVANVRLTKAQRAHIDLYTVVPVGYREQIEAPGTVDFDNNQAHHFWCGELMA